MELVEKKGTELTELQISISHAITRAAHGLTLVEKRIVALFIAKFDNSKHRKALGRVIPLQDATIRITAKEYSDTFDIPMNIAYRDLLKGTDKFFDRYWRVIQETPKGKKEFKYNWLEGVVYHHGEGWVEATFGQKTIPHLVFNLKDQYTKYKLKSTIALTSGYAWRLWELMAQFANTKKPANEERLVRISLEDFRYSMDAPKSYKYSQIRQKIIESSIEQIHKQNQIKVTWRAIKVGRSVVSLEFKFKPCDQLDLF
ncbi:replication initiation protein [uncultured Shewanella sp.]|uniref:replication initiation protein n=1 Tax=uncultured Shewanella sp. TaxID=173975 RepID=UPI00261A1C43|nr:replication initiation protein [uncultured Shewanella sp.]